MHPVSSSNLAQKHDYPRKPSKKSRHKSNIKAGPKFDKLDSQKNCHLGKDGKGGRNAGGSNFYC